MASRGAECFSVAPKRKAFFWVLYTRLLLLYSWFIPCTTPDSHPPFFPILYFRRGVCVPFISSSECHVFLRVDIPLLAGDLLSHHEMEWVALYMKLYRTLSSDIEYPQILEPWCESKFQLVLVHQEDSVLGMKFTLERLRQGDCHEFEVSLNYNVILFLSII